MYMCVLFASINLQLITHRIQTVRAANCYEIATLMSNLVGANGEQFEQLRAVNYAFI
jgi:hypothetical protein